MAGGRLTQAVLPWLPGGAAEIAPGVGLLTLPDGGGQIWVHGMATFTWEAGDEAARRLAAVQVTKLKAATQRQVAAALGTDLATVWRWVSAYRENGLAGLLPARKGPKGPIKLTPELTAKINDLDAQGLGLEAIASQCGVSTFAVRTALGRVPARPRAAAPAREERQPGEDTAGQTAAPHARTLRTAPPHGTSSSPPPRRRRWPGRCCRRRCGRARRSGQHRRPGRGCRGRRRAAAGAAGPGAADRERVLARFGLLGDGAAPVFSAGAATRWPGC